MTKKLEQEVAAFNRRFSVGDEVDYHEVIGDGKAQRLRTRTPAQILSGHTAVVWLEGKSGCVCCSHCFAPPGPAAFVVDQGTLGALDRAMARQQALAQDVDRAYPGDRYASLIVREDIEELQALRAHLAAGIVPIGGE